MVLLIEIEIGDYFTSIIAAVFIIVKFTIMMLMYIMLMTLSFKPSSYSAFKIII
jgi:hypothetical protein